MWYHPCQATQGIATFACLLAADPFPACPPPRSGEDMGLLTAHAAAPVKLEAAFVYLPAITPL